VNFAPFKIIGAEQIVGISQMISIKHLTVGIKIIFSADISVGEMNSV
jgi:hypothetical protein